MKDQEFKKRLKRMKTRIPYLANQVFALRSKSYMGCGFHYAMEKELGKVISWINDNDFLYTPKTKDRFMNRMILEICYSGLAKDIVKAKQSTKPPITKTCKNCKWWGVDYDGTCDFEVEKGPTRFEVEAEADDQGLSCFLHTGPDFGCIHFRNR